MLQETVLIITIVLMAVVAATFAYVALSTGSQATDYPSIQSRSYRLRNQFFWLLIVAGVLICLLTLFDLPYAANRGEIPDDAVQVNIEGRQWAWIMDKTEATAGDTVIFNVSAADVTHGLGVYDPDMNMIGQAQAMPSGYINRLRLTLDKPGTYKLLCMEYCGLAHHNMISEFTVKAP
ncbi:MAG: cytochrome C oxidase subunit II [Arenicella sp.]